MTAERACTAVIDGARGHGRLTPSAPRVASGEMRTVRKRREWMVLAALAMVVVGVA
jgi:hypothetical protein